MPHAAQSCSSWCTLYKDHPVNCTGHCAVPRSTSTSTPAAAKSSTTTRPSSSWKATVRVPGGADLYGVPILQEHRRVPIYKIWIEGHFFFKKKEREKETNKYCQNCAAGSYCRSYCANTRTAETHPLHIIVNSKRDAVPTWPRPELTP